MERQRFRELRALLRESARQHRDGPCCTHRDVTIVVVLLWAVLHHKPVVWATKPEHWPGDLRPRPLPSQSCMSRRLRTASVIALIQCFHQVARRRLPSSDIKIVDGRPLPVGGCSKDREARYGYAAGIKQRGYKLHLLCDAHGGVDQWLVAPMNHAEPAAAQELLEASPPCAYVLGDGNYDNNALYEQAGQRGIQWLALPRYAGSQAPGHHSHSEHRLAIWHWARSKHGRRLIKRARNPIERVNAWQGQAAVGLGALPHHVRSLHRVRLWTAIKIIIYHHWLQPRLTRRLGRCGA